MAKKYSQCPQCKRDLPVGAIKCHSCGSWVPRHRRFFEGVKSSVPLLTFIVLGVTVYQLVLMREAAKQGQESIDLLKQTVARMDSSLSLQIQDLAIRIQQKELDAKRVKISEEQSKPKIQIWTPTITVSDSGFYVYTDIGNSGSSDAENVRILFTYKVPRSIQDTLSFPFVLNKMSAGYKKNFENFIKTVSPLAWDFYSKIDVKYKSSLFEGVLSERKYFEHIYHKDSRKFSTKTLDEIQSKKLGF